jgi:hypothetical protein
MHSSTKTGFPLIQVPYCERSAVFLQELCHLDDQCNEKKMSSMKLGEFHYESTVLIESKPVQLSCEHLPSNPLISCHSLGSPNSYFVNVYK